METLVDIKDILGSDEAMSRGEAKQLCAQIEGAARIILDFSGVAFIGQGFADQLFRVFHEAHPEIELIPQNMNEDVQRMYQHVLLRAKELERDI